MIAAGPASVEALKAPKSQPEPMIEPMLAKSSPTTSDVALEARLVLVGRGVRLGRGGHGSSECRRAGQIRATSDRKTHRHFIPRTGGDVQDIRGCIAVKFVFTV